MYNCNDVTGYSPYLLMFGRESRHLPVDLCFGGSPEGEKEMKSQKYVTTLRSDLHKAYQLATEATDGQTETEQECT